MMGGRSFPMIGKLAHVRSRGDVLVASLVITGVSVVCAVVLTACAAHSLNTAGDFNALRVAAEIAAVIAFVISFWVVDAIRKILKGKRLIERLAMTDDLTGLPNRRAFLAAAERAVDQIGGVASSPALLIVDLDHFKRVNDAYGHRAGDQALQATAQALARSVRSDVDFVGRLGGEEFVVLLGAVDEETARRAAESARAAIAAMRVATPNGEIAVTASIGYTPLVAGDSVSAALQRADEALYAAKRAGRNQIASRAPDGGEVPATEDGQLRRDAPARLRRSA
jgi:diguanylate cyclase (GGDEF)-like protein